MFETYCNAPDRFTLWSRFLVDQGVRTMAEIGVFRGAFAAHVLAAAPAIERYYLIDSWRHLAEWNKPANADDATFASYLEDTLEATAFAAERRRLLRGRTLDVIEQIPDASLDFVYIDGDHTLRGITLDLIASLPKVRPGGWIGGDDLCDSIWQHPAQYEPTLVFPWAVHFAEAHGLAIHVLPHQQFALRNVRDGFRVIDHTGRYGDRSLRRQLARER